MSRISTHILDLNLGKPAADVLVRLFFSPSKSNEKWAEIGYGQTNKDGRVVNFLKEDQKILPGHYKLKFFLTEYIQNQHLTVDPFFPEVEIQFSFQKVEEHYHIPLLFNQFGYSTYKGS